MLELEGANRRINLLFIGCLKGQTLEIINQVTSVSPLVIYRAYFSTLSIERKSLLVAIRSDDCSSRNDGHSHWSHTYTSCLIIFVAPVVEAGIMIVRVQRSTIPVISALPMAPSPNWELFKQAMPESIDLQVFLY